MPKTSAGFNARQLGQIKALYMDEAIALARICDQFELTYYELGKLVKNQNWPQRSTKQVQKKSLMKRMKAIAGHHIRALEKSLNTEDQKSSAADRDRDARTLRTLLKIIEDLNGLSIAANQTTNKDEELSINASQRIEIAKRLEALRGKD